MEAAFPPARGSPGIRARQGLRRGPRRFARALGPARVECVRVSVSAGVIDQGPTGKYPLNFFKLM